MDENTPVNGTRINKWLSNAGICSRREADRMLEEGRITIDGVRAVPGSRLLPGQTVAIDGRPVHEDGARKVLIAFNKPKGIVCTTDTRREKDNIIEELRRDIRDKYQSYIDNYESIGSLVYDSKVRSDQMIRDAETKREKIIADADAEARRKIDAIQAEIDKRIDDGEQRYKAVEEELENIVDTVNKVQRKFMDSYRSIHRIVQDVPGMGSSEEEDD